MYVFYIGLWLNCHCIISKSSIVYSLFFFKFQDKLRLLIRDLLGKNIKYI